MLILHKLRMIGIKDLDLWVIPLLVDATMTLLLVVELPVFSVSSRVVQKGNCLEEKDALKYNKQYNLRKP